MAKVEIHYTSGKVETEYNCGTSVYNGLLYIWELGTRKGKSPRRTIPLNQLHSKKRTGRKGIFITKF